MPIPPATKALILDLDGVLWVDTESIGDLPANFRRIRELGLKVTLATNNSTRTAKERLEKLAGFGVDIEGINVLTSSIATATLLKEKFPQGGELYVVGMEGIIGELEKVGFRTFSENNLPQNPLAVVVGMDWELNYEKIANASILIQKGAPFYATNPDKTFPTPRGLMPGAGTLLAAVETASGTAPIIAGKPSPFLLKLAMRKMNVSPAETIMVGDRLETDILAAQNAGCRAALVLSGVTSRARAEAWSPRVDIIAEDLASLLGVNN